MRLVQYRAIQGVRLGLYAAGRVLDAANAAHASRQNPAYFSSTLALLDAGPRAIEFLETLRPETDGVLMDESRLTHPVAARKIVAIGLNYRDHVEETGMPTPKAPLCFAKFTSSLSGPFDAIRLPEPEATVDWEGELGVVIGRKASHVSESEAMECVAGYVAFNDVSERRWQFADGQWTRGKSADTFSPNGPYLVTRDEVPDPGHLRITTRVNGKVMQDSNTDQLIFGIAELISYFSKSFTLEPGDIIATGTPPGVGFSRKPPVFLKDGDVVEVEIEHVGKIANRVQCGY
jgi:2-keto-4-pentenoate hydratase/2-oxohepta-3-ene-1,7-dioic acid hydratase in catechol pathway